MKQANKFKKENSFTNFFKKIDKSKLVTTIIMLIPTYLMILPFLWMLSTSIKSPSEVFLYPIQWLPEKPDWSHHLNIWFGDGNFPLYYFNSLKIAVMGTTGAVLFALLAAYGFSKIQFRGKDIIFMLYLSMMMIPPQVLFVPKFIMFDWMGIYNTHWSIILPGSITIIGVFMFRQFLLGIPKEISEAAHIDGASHFRILTTIILPMARPVIATYAILNFTWEWNNYEDALVFLLDESLYTIPLGLDSFVREYSVDYNGMMAAAGAAVIPMIIVFIIGQKYIVEGIASSAVKG